MNDKELQGKLLHDMGLHNPSDYNRQRVEAFLEDLGVEAPSGCQLHVGDSVVFINEAGVEFVFRVLGFVRPEQQNSYRPDRKVFLVNESYWFPVPIESLRKI